MTEGPLMICVKQLKRANTHSKKVSMQTFRPVHMQTASGTI